jgi:hypothetical protein
VPSQTRDCATIHREYVLNAAVPNALNDNFASAHKVALEDFTRAGN